MPSPFMSRTTMVVSVWLLRQEYNAQHDRTLEYRG